MSNSKIDIRSLSKDELIDYLLSVNEKKYRANQVWEWLWKKWVSSFDEMRNVPAGLREKLDNHFYIHHIEILSEEKSFDGTIKIAFKLEDGHTVEGVFIPTEDRFTACISSQVGCPLGCKMCATATLGFKRDLKFSEIYDQVYIINSIANKEIERSLSNIVYMGMGEPLLNYDNVKQSIDLITSHETLTIAPKRITLSTIGIVKRIKQMADEDFKIRLAVSLHATNNTKRSNLMPYNKKDSVEDLIDGINYYTKKTGKKVTLEYVMLKGYNDTLEDAKELVSICAKTNSKLNLIEYNPNDLCDFESSSDEEFSKFRNYLIEKNILVLIRKSRGKDIAGACGQLANKSK